MFQIKRIYDKPSEDDGYRVLVDRLWPRGVSKQQAGLDVWLKDVAPSPELRTWFDHKPERFAEFSAKYTEELLHNPTVKILQNATHDHAQVTLLYAAKNSTINHAIILKKFLEHNTKTNKDTNTEKDSVDAYINQFDGEVRTRLFKMRELIKVIVPDAQEGIMYGLVGYKLNKKPLVYFGGFKNHIGFYATPNGHDEFREEFMKYKQGKGSVQFPNDQPLPIGLIKRVVTYRKDELNHVAHP